MAAPSHVDVAAVLNRKQQSHTAMAALMDLLNEDIKKPAAPSYKASGSNKQATSTRFPVTILNRTSAPTAGFNGGPPGQVFHYLVICENFGTTEILASVGERTADGRLILRVKGVQPMTEDQLKKATAEAAERDAKSKRKSPSYVPKKYEYDAGFEEVPVLLRFSVFAPVGPFKDERNNPFGPGSRVFIGGVQPVHKMKANENKDLHEQAYGVQWEVSNMLANTNVQASSTPLLTTWRSMMTKNHIVNFYKGPGGGWSTKNTTEEDRKEMAKWVEEHTVEKNKFRAGRHYMAQTERPFLNQPIVIPFGIEARRQGWHLGARKSVLFVKVAWGDKTADWLEIRKAPETPLRLFDFKIEAISIEKIYRTRPVRKRHAIEVHVSDRAGEDIINALGIVRKERYAAVAPTLIPFCPGFFVGMLSAVQSEGMAINDPQVNPVDEVTKFPAKGVHSGAIYSAVRIDMDLAAGLVVSPNSFEITPSAAQQAIEAQFGVPDPTEQTSPWAKENPLNQSPGRQVINMFEATDKVENLKGYTFFLVFAIAAQARGNVSRARNAMTRKGEDPVQRMSALFFTAQNTDETGDADLDAINGMPRPDFNKPDEYCLFAVRNEEVVRARAQAQQPELTPEELMEAALKYEEEESARLGPLPEDPDLESPSQEAIAERSEQQAAEQQEAPEVRRSSTPERQRRSVGKTPGGSKKKKAPVKPKVVTLPTDDVDDDFAAGL